MSSQLKNLSTYNPDEVPDGRKLKIGIVVSEWNREVTQELEKGAREALLAHGVKSESLLIHRVPGSFELPLGAKLLLENKDIDAVIILGCVIQGETRHFDFICQAVSQGCMNVGLEYHTPVVFGVLTTNTLEQAMDRAGGKHGNKGTEAAITALKMAALSKNIR
jgi:6,7-dimethyl-8-ribityllumazine synthase